MGTVSEKLTRESFRDMYAGRKPAFELLDGEAVQKSVATEPHSALQVVLTLVLRELGFKARTELTLAIDKSWEPTPDVCGILGKSEDPYPARPIAVAIEILSPADSFTRVIRKCRRYAEWGIPDILVFDPVEREARYWDLQSGDLLRVKERYRFRSLPAELALEEVLRRLEEELK